ncbi:MAG: DUF2950 family protein [Planctomycetota bacterium]|nr:DUF2950 family protein [Planctomycetota bacterium]
MQRATSIPALLSLVLFLGASGAQEGSDIQPVNLLPADSVLVVQADLGELLARCAATPLGRFLGEPEARAFLSEPLKSMDAALEGWRKRYPALPSAATLAKLGGVRAAFALQLRPTGDPTVPPAPAPLFVAWLERPEALERELRLLPAMKLPSGLEAYGEEGLWLALSGHWLFGAAARDDLEALQAAAAKPEQGLGRSERWKQVAAALGEKAPLKAWWDLGAVREHLLNLPDDPDVRAVLPDGPAKLLAALGLDDVKSLGFSLGFQGERFDFRVASEAPRKADAPRRGLLKLFEGEGPVQARLLRHVPEEASWFYLTRIEPRRLLPMLRDGLEAASGNNLAAGQLAMVLMGFRVISGVDLEEDLLATLGDEWAITDTQGGGALMDHLPGLAVVGTSRDPLRFAMAAQKVLDFAAQRAPRRLDVKSKLGVFDGVPIHYLSIAMSDLSPSVAVKDGVVVLSPTLAGARRQLRHLALNPARDIRSNPDFQAAYAEALGAKLPEGDGAALPAMLRYLDPRRVQVSRLLGTALAGSLAFGPDLPGLFETQEGLRRTRNLAALHMLGLALEVFRAPAAGEPRPLPAQPHELLGHARGEGLGATLDLSGVTYVGGLRTDDPPETLAAFSRLDSRWDAPCAVLRLSGQVEQLAAAETQKLLAAQREAFKQAGRETSERAGAPAPLGRPSSWWTRAWQARAEERNLLALDALRVLRSVDFALLPDLRAFEQTLRPGVSWTETSDWGVVSHTVGSYPLPALDAAGGVVPLGVAALALPEVVRGRGGSNEALAREDLRAVAAGQWYYRMADWDRDKVHGYAGSLKELADRGMLEAALGRAEAAAGAPGVPRRGYLFRMLPLQGARAPGGAKSYVVDGRWTGGYAVLAWPARYGLDGRRCFLLGPGGAIFDADHGAFTPALVENMQAFDPDPERGWRRLE